MTTTTSSATAVVATIASAVTGASSAGPRILVTGATGNTGFCTLCCISSSPEFAKIGASVRAACYRQSKKIDQVRQKCPQVEIVTVDAEIADDLDNAFQDIDYAYIIPSSSSNRVQHVKNYVDAAKRNNVKVCCIKDFTRTTFSYLPSSFYSCLGFAMNRRAHDLGWNLKRWNDTLKIVVLPTHLFERVSHHFYDDACSYHHSCTLNVLDRSSLSASCRNILLTDL
jgi:hypothetical protein